MQLWFLGFSGRKDVLLIYISTVDKNLKLFFNFTFIEFKIVRKILFMVFSFSFPSPGRSIVCLSMSVVQNLLMHKVFSVKIIRLTSKFPC